MPAMARQRYLNAEEASFALDVRMRGGGISPLWGPDGGMRHAAAGARPDANVPPPPGSGSKGSGGTGDPRRIGSVATWVGGAIQIGTRDQRADRAKVTVSTGGLSGGADIKLAEGATVGIGGRSEEHPSELPSLMRSSYSVYWLKKKNKRRKEM